MSLNNGINVRLPPDIRERLERLADQYGVKASVLIRQAIGEKLDEIERQSAVIISASGTGSQAAGGDIINVRKKNKK